MRPALGITCAMVLMLGAACSRPAAPPVARAAASVPAAIVEVSGGKQVSTIGTPLEQPLVIQVNDAQGAAVAGATVWFRSANGVAFEPTSGVTGSDGQFTFAATLGTVAGRYQIAALTTGASRKTIELRIEERALGFEHNQGRQLSDFYCALSRSGIDTRARVQSRQSHRPSARV